MGARDFITYADGADPRAAFQAAVEEARRHHGQMTHTGTIAEKEDFTVVPERPLPLEEAREEARLRARMQDGWTCRKYGPASALPVAGPHGQITGWLFFGLARC